MEAWVGQLEPLKYRHCSYHDHRSLCFFKSDSPSMSASQVNATDWTHYSSEVTYQITATHVVTGALAVSNSHLLLHLVPGVRRVRRGLNTHSC